MTQSISYYVDTPAIQTAMKRWGLSFQHLSPADRFKLIELLSSAAAELLEMGESTPLANNALAMVIWDADEPQILEFLEGVDAEFTSPGQVAGLIAGIASGLQLSVYPLDIAG